MTDGLEIKAIEATRRRWREAATFAGDYFFSTTPVQELVRSFDATPRAAVREVSDGLVYRDFITVGLLVKRVAHSRRAGRQEADQR